MNISRKRALAVFNLASGLLPNALLLLGRQGG